MRVPRALALSSVLALSIAVPARGDVPDGARSEAAERFDRAIHLVNAGDLAGGLVEFLRAYTLRPSAIVLYNVGLVYAALNRPVEAVHALERAVSGPEALKPESAQRARDVLREQRDKIGQVHLSTNVREGVIEVDNVEYGKLPPSGPIEMAVGPHVIGVIAPGYAPARQVIAVAGREHVEARLQLVAIEGLLAHISVTCRVPAADVVVDGERVGRTPLETTVTVAPGTHEVEVRRAGYIPATRTIALQDGARGDLTLQPLIDKAALTQQGGRLAITASETQAVVSIDDEEFGLVAGPIDLPAGPHRLRLERAGFLPAQRDVDVPIRGTSAVSMVFAPTPETRAHYALSAQNHRIRSLVTIGAGAAVAAGGVALAAVASNQLPIARSTLASTEADFRRGSGAPCDQGNLMMPLEACKARINDAAANAANLETARTVGWVLGGVGAAAVVAGLVLLVTGDDPHRYDEKPADRGLGGPRILVAMGSDGVSVTAAAPF